MSYSFAEESIPDETFLSLTRRPTSIKKLPTNVSVVTAQQIEDLGAKSIDQVLQLLPSVDVSRTGTEGSFSSIRMRGAPKSAQVQIVVDDQPYGGVSGDQLVDISRIPVENIERIEVVRGASSILYGPNTVGGVIHIMTKQHTSDTPMLSIGHEIGSFNSHSIREQVGASSGLTDVHATYSQYKTDGYQENGDSENSNGSANVGLSFPNGSRIGLQFARNEQHAGVPQGTAIPISDWDGHKERAAANPTKRADANRTGGRLRGNFPVSSGQIQTTFFGSDDHYLASKSVSPLDDPDLEKNTHVYGNDTRFIFNNGFLLGGSWERDEQRTDSLFFTVEPHQVTNWSLYSQQDLEWGALELIPALRFDQHSGYGNQYNPRLTGVIHAGDKVNLTGNVARSFRAPDFSELFYKSPSVTPNPDLKPEIAWTYDLGMGLFPNPGTEIKLTGYHTTIKDRIEFIFNTFPTPSVYRNTNRAEINGVEFEWLQKIGRVRQTFNYAYRHARGTQTNTSKYVALALTPTHVINYILDVDLGAGFKMGNTVEYRSDQFKSPNYAGIRVPPYAVWNLRLSKSIKAVSVFAAINNVANRRYAEMFDTEPTFPFGDTLNPMDPRTYKAGIDITFGKS